MQFAISANKLYRVLYWTLYLGLCFISGWFASGVLENYISRKTSFSQDKEIATKRPVISITLNRVSGEWPELKENKNTWISYCTGYKAWPLQCEFLNFGENNFLIKDINKTEKVLLDQLGHNPNITRIIPLTNLLEEKAKANVMVYTLRSKLNLTVNVILTSLDNSLGSQYVKYKDGDYLQYEVGKNSYRRFFIKPESFCLKQQNAIKNHIMIALHQNSTNLISAKHHAQQNAFLECFPMGKITALHFVKI